MPMTNDQTQIVEQYKQSQAMTVRAKETVLSRIRIQQQMREAEEHQLEELQRKARVKEAEFISERKTCDTKTIKEGMQSIYDFIDAFGQEETSMGSYYDSLKYYLRDFETKMIAEVNQNIDPGWRDPVETVNQLNETVKTVLHPLVSLEDKGKKIDEFEVKTRNGTLSIEAKEAIAISIGFLAVTAAAMSPLGLLFLSGAAVLGIGLALGIGVPALMGLFYAGSTYRQDDTRGKEIVEQLKSTNETRSQLYGNFFTKPTVTETQALTALRPC